MNTQGITYILLKACQVNESQLLQLLQPFQGLFPANDAEYHALCTAMRRMGHIIERNPGNLASTLRGHAQSPNFFADTADQRLDPWSNTFMINNTPHGNAQPPREMYTLQPPTPSYTQEWASWGPTHAEGYRPAPHWNAQSEYYTEGAEDVSGTDTDTVSSLGETPYTMPQGTPEEQRQ